MREERNFFRIVYCVGNPLPVYSLSRHAGQLIPMTSSRRANPYYLRLAENFA
jgi:hypothetical protein